MLLLSLLLALSAHADDTAANKIMPAPAPVKGGLDKNVIDEKVKADMPKIVACYNENAPAAGPMPAGMVSTRFTIGADGKVTKVDILDSRLKNPSIEGCLTKELQSLVFPAPAGGGSVQVDYPFNFAPTKKAGKKKRK